MIDRYSRKEMSSLWSEKAKYQAWLKCEILACEAWGKLGIIPMEDVELIAQKASFSIERIKELEIETKHDVIAFTRAVSETLGEEKKWIHYGLTSTDIVDTAYGYIYKQVNDLLRDNILRIIEILKAKALKYKHTVQIGRTHGIHAEITTFGMKLALWYAEMERNLKRFDFARRDIEIGKMSGAVGTHANIPIFVEEYVCSKLGINAAKISTQTLQRDRHAFYITTLALIATTLEKMATEIRHLQRTEIREVEEYFDIKQKGSSAMPHKRNPIGSENISGCARVMRGYIIPIFEDIPLWHERDISHSSVERIIMPDATILLDYMLNRFAKILENLVVFENRMEQNIYLTNGVIFSQRVLLKLVDKGLSREEAYDLVQPKAIEAYQKNIAFKNLLINDNEITKYLSTKEIDDCFNISYHLKAVDEVFEKLGL
ncbi:MAG TPA: adenylosuccinate lyase [Haloplasmataceae bacterium]